MMKLTIFQSDKGDCLSLTGSDGTMMLIDGGMDSSYSKHVAPELEKLHSSGRAIDLVYVSHIDEDHIAGVLRLMDDLVEWRVHEFQMESGNTHHPKPRNPRPPEIKGIWHNAFHEVIGENSGPVADMLAAVANTLSANVTASSASLTSACRGLVTSERHAVRLSRRIGQRQLNIPLNEQFGGKLILVRPNPSPIELGSMRLSVIGPFEEDLRVLRKEWNEWLADNTKFLQEIARRSRTDEERLLGNEMDRIFVPLFERAEELGKRGNVTAPNLASLMLYVEEPGKTVLLTGDGHADDILKGLAHIDKLRDGRIHVNVLKVQHHGSENNIHSAFCQAVTADHYVFCGNGEHDNPNLEVVKTIIDSRLKQENGLPFTFWFNSSSKVTLKPENKLHMEKVENLVEEAANGSAGRLKRRFLTNGPSIELSI